MNGINKINDPMKLIIIPLLIIFIMPIDLEGIDGKGLKQLPAKQFSYKDKDLPIEKRVEDLLSRMTLEEKVAQVTGSKVPNEEIVGIRGNKRLGIPAFEIEHGPYGFKGWFKANEPKSIGTYFPVSIAQASTWDPGIVEEITTAMGKEMRAAGGHANAGPAMNIIRDPRTGRSFEYFSEDPYLNGHIAVAYTKGLQSQKVMATLKHYICNNQEFGRGGLDVIVDERALHEIYLPGFKAAIQEGCAWIVMGAYNRLNGTYCCEHPYILTEILRKEWGFKGFVLSDWSGTHSTVGSANSGLDLEMPRERWYGKKLLKAVKSGQVSQETLNTMVGNILRGMFWVGAFDEKPSLDKNILNCTEHRLVARKASAKSMVLLKNESAVLPFNLKKIKKIAVIGPNGDYGPHYNNGEYNIHLLQGGGSARLEVKREKMVTPLAGIKSKVGGKVEVTYAPGCYAESGCGVIKAKYLRTPDGKKKGLLAKYYDNNNLKGKPVKTEIAENLFYSWISDLPIPEASHDGYDGKHFSVEWTGKIIPPKTRTYTFEVRNESGDAKLFINRRLVAHNERGNRTDWNDMGTIELKAGKEYDIRIEYVQMETKADVRVGWDYENETWLKEAVELAKKSDVVILTVGLSGNMGDTEAGDRKTLRLFPAQERLINEIARVNKNMAVVLMAGSAVAMDKWLDNVSSVLMI